MDLNIFNLMLIHHPSTKQTQNLQYSQFIAANASSTGNTNRPTVQLDETGKQCQTVPVCRLRAAYQGCLHP